MSSSSEVDITITAVDNASDVIQGVQTNLQDLSTAAGDTSEAMTETADASAAASSGLAGVSTQTGFSMAGFYALGSVVRTSISDFERFQMGQVRIEAQTLAVQKAQEAYNAAVAKYGASSQQAVDAATKLQVAQDRLNVTQEKQNLMYVQFAAQIPQYIGSIGLMAQSFGGISGVVEGLGGALSGLGGMLGDASEGFVGLLGAIGPVGWAIIAVVAAIAVLYEAWTNDWGGIREKVAWAVDEIQKLLGNLGGILDTVKNALGGVVSWLESNWKDLLIGALTGPVGLALMAWKDNWGGFRDVVSNALSGVKDDVMNALSGAESWFSGLQKSTANALFEVRQVIQNEHPQLAGVLDALMLMVQGKWNDAFGVLGRLTQNALDDTRKSIENGLTAIKDSVGTSLSGAFDGLTKTFTDLRDTADQVWDKIGDSVKTKFPVIGDAIQVGMDLLNGNWQKAWNDLTAIPGQVLQQVSDTVQGLGKGISDAIGILGSALTDAANTLNTAFHMIQDAVGGFMTWMHDTFQNFYDFLVGHSLWQDLWDALAQVVTDMGKVIGGIVTDMLTMLQDLFKGGMDLIGTILTTGFTVTFETVKTIVSGAVGVLKGLIGSVQILIQGTTKDWSTLVDAVNSTVDSLKDTITNFWSWAQDYWKSQVSAIVDITQPQLDLIVSKVQSASGDMQTTWSGALDNMVSSTQSAFQSMVDTISRQVDAIINKLQAAQDAISKHSIWPDMLNMMVNQTRTAMGAIQGEFDKGLTSQSGIMPLMKAVAPTTGATSAQSSTPLTAQGQQAINLPINVYLDGQQIQTLMERRLVQTLTRDASRSKRA